MKNILIFGATGNIGAYFTKYLVDNLNKKEYEIIAIGRKSTNFFERYGIKYIQVDICNECDFEKLPTNNIYAIVNLAGILPAYIKSYNPFNYIETNIKGSLRILEFARKNNVDRVLFSNTWNEQTGYLEEEEILRPDMPRKLIYTGDHALYTISKCTVADIMEHYKQEYGIKNFVFRLPNVYLYNPSQYYYVDCTKKLVAYRYMIERAIKGLDIELWGNPDAFKDILYIKDLCQLMYCALLTDVNGGTYNAGTGIKTTLREQIQGIIDVFSPNNTSKIINKPEKASFASFVMDIEKAKNELNYKPEYTYIKYLEDYRQEREVNQFADLWQN